MRIICLLFSTCHMLMVSCLSNGDSYIDHVIGDERRNCIRIYDCPPGHEILPCIKPHTKDICKECPKGYKQPDYISSSEDLSATKCFKPKGECLAHDVKDIRTPNTKQCDFHKHCQCKTEECYFGDPCHCDERRGDPCRPGFTMNKAGDCVECPPGTEKKKNGCGPCMRIQKKITRINSITTTSVPVILQKVPLREIIDQKEKEDDTMNILTTSFLEITEQNSELTKQQSKRKNIDSDQSSTLIPIIAILSVILVICVCVLVYCVGHQRKQHDNDVERAPDEANQQLLQQPGNQDHIQDAPIQINGNNNIPMEDENDLQNGVNNNRMENKNNLQNGNIPIQNGHGILPNGIVQNIAPSNLSLKTVTSSTDQPESRSSSKNKTEDQPIRDNISNQADKNYPEQNQSSMALEITKMINNNKVVPSQNADKCIENTSAVTDEIFDSNEKGNSLEIKTNAQQINHVQRQCSEQSVIHVNPPKSPERGSNLNLPNLSLLDAKSLIPSATQLTDVCSSPVVQETHDLIHQIRVEPLTSSGIGSSISENGIPCRSPMSKEADDGKPQEYEHLVSASDRNTESMPSGLENHNYNLIGENRYSVGKQSTDTKQINTLLDSGVCETSRQS